MKLEDILTEFGKGCGCSEGNPADCVECLNAAVRAIHRMRDSETIVAAALEIEGMTFSLPQPARHGHLHMVCHTLGLPTDLYLRGTQGFLTNTGRFVNRVMAKHIAHRAGQPQMRPLEDRHQRDLFSEDLW